MSLRLHRRLGADADGPLYGPAEPIEVVVHGPLYAADPSGSGIGDGFFELEQQLPALVAGDLVLGGDLAWECVLSGRPATIGLLNGRRSTQVRLAG